MTQWLKIYNLENKRMSDVMRLNLNRVQCNLFLYLFLYLLAACLAEGWTVISRFTQYISHEPYEKNEFSLSG